jgi:hypothetical protein
VTFEKDPPLAQARPPGEDPALAHNEHPLAAQSVAPDSVTPAAGAIATPEPADAPPVTAIPTNG